MATKLTKEQEALLAIFGRLKKKDRVFLLKYADATLQKRKPAAQTKQIAREADHA